MLGVEPVTCTPLRIGILTREFQYFTKNYPTHFDRLMWERCTVSHLASYGVVSYVQLLYAERI